MKKAVSVFLVICTLFLFVGCVKNPVDPKYVITGKDLLENISKRDVDGKPIDERFTAAYDGFSLDIFRSCLEGVEDGENLLVSPASVMIALAMTANGASGATKTAMENVLGGIDVSVLNEYLFEYVKNLPSDEKNKLAVANSVWVRDMQDFSVNENFLQSVVDYYSASAYKAAFDDVTVRDINHWVSENTDGMIDKIIEEIGKDTMMYLINAVLFDAKWASPYFENEVSRGIFTNSKGEKRTVDMMKSEEYSYIEDENCVGFVKPYDNGYSFVAILPDGTVEDFVASLTESRFENLLNGAEHAVVFASLPKFSYDYSTSLKSVLESLGMGVAFTDYADFSYISSTPLLISDVIHKTHIEVAEEGTRAAAITAVVLDKALAADPGQTKTVVLDRPFLYMIVENETNTPIFFGAVNDIK